MTIFSKTLQLLPKFKYKFHLFKYQQSSVVLYILSGSEGWPSLCHCLVRGINQREASRDQLQCGRCEVVRELCRCGQSYCIVRASAVMGRASAWGDTTLLDRGYLHAHRWEYWWHRGDRRRWLQLGVDAHQQTDHHRLVIEKTWVKPLTQMSSCVILIASGRGFLTGPLFSLPRISGICFQPNGE